MRHYDIARVGGGTVVGYPVKSLQDMSFEEIQNKYLKMCAKANGNVSVCSKCPTPCAEGKRAIQLLANEIYDDPPIPLYGGKTLIEKAREENMLRRQKLEQEKQKKDVMISKDNRTYIDDWYEKAKASGDPVKWVMETYGIDRTKAKSKIYCWEYRHQEKKTEEKPVEKSREELKDLTVPDSIESKMDALMKLQEKHKNVMLEMQKQYEKAKAEYEAISKKIDILCSAVDILNN